ncbi:MAG: hypothetical protein JST66_00545 [Bacteroidetes bacterium]|nr:hypothetical protein [Bacteroidota bacterium]
MHTTNYTNTFIAVADDCPVDKAEVPASKAGGPSVAEHQFTLLHDRPYALTSDDVLFTVHAERQGIPESEREAARAAFFSKGQPCMRASPLTKRYGFGVHSDARGRIALVPLGSPEYERLAKDERLEQVKAMRSKRA